MTLLHLLHPHLDESAVVRQKLFSGSFRSAHAAAGHSDGRFSIGDRQLLRSTTRRPDFTYENRALKLSIFRGFEHFGGFPRAKEH
jgi:hypothetical protein